MRWQVAMLSMRFDDARSITNYVADTTSRTRGSAKSMSIVRPHQLSGPRGNLQHVCLSDGIVQQHLLGCLEPTLLILGIRPPHTKKSPNDGRAHRRSYAGRWHAEVEIVSYYSHCPPLGEHCQLPPNSSTASGMDRCSCSCSPRPPLDVHARTCAVAAYDSRQPGSLLKPSGVGTAMGSPKVAGGAVKKRDRWCRPPRDVALIASTPLHASF
eukprot:3472856-Pleurochrysis_carterae.AAC.3